MKLEQLSRVFNTESRTSHVCAECGQKSGYSWTLMHHWCKALLGSAWFKCDRQREGRQRSEESTPPRRLEHSPNFCCATTVQNALKSAKIKSTINISPSMLLSSFPCSLHLLHDYLTAMEAPSSWRFL